MIRHLARFRYELRKFLRFSEQAARNAGLTPQQHQLLLGVAGFTGRGWATISELAEFLQERHNAVVGLVDAPEQFEETLGDLPAGAALRRQPDTRCDLLLWFATSRADVEQRIEQMAALAGAGGLWIIWPKQAAGPAGRAGPAVAGDLTERTVRSVGLAAGLADYKIAAVDATWAGLRFPRRAPARRQ